MNRHLALDQLEQYVARSGGADEIIAIAEHLEACFECRDRAMVLVDPGSALPLPRDSISSPLARRVTTWQAVVIWIALVLGLSALVGFVVLQR